MRKIFLLKTPSLPSLRGFAPPPQKTLKSISTNLKILVLDQMGYLIRLGPQQELLVSKPYI